MRILFYIFCIINFTFSFDFSNLDNIKADFKQIVKSNQDKTICIVSHGCALGTLVTWLDHRPVEAMRCEDLSHNTGVTTVTEENGVFTLVKFDDLSHLPKEMQTGFTKTKPKQGR